MPETKKLSTVWSDMEATQRPFLDRARESALYTIPTLMPRDGHNEHAKFDTPYQSMGSRGVNNMASKLTLAMFPTGTPFFRHELTTEDKARIESESDSTIAEVERGLMELERSFMRSFEDQSIRSSAFESFKQLLVAGNVLLHFPKVGGMHVYPLSKFCVSRDRDGKPMEIILRECRKAGSFTQEDKEMYGIKQDARMETVEVYTYIYRDGRKYTTYQTIKDVEVKGSRGTYPLKRLPWLPVRLIKVDGEDYGRGYVEEYLGDLLSLEGLSQAIVEASAAAARVIWLRNPSGMTESEDVARAESGDIVDGMPEDVRALQLEKFGDMRVASETVAELKNAMSAAFLLNSAVQRQAERVTAEEIQYVARELEDALGGMYSILLAEYQKPMLDMLIYRARSRNELTKLPDGFAEPVITTGLDALGRNHDMVKLDVFSRKVLELGEVGLGQLHINELINRYANAASVDPKDLVKTAQELQQEAQRRQQQMAQQQAYQAQLEGISKQGPQQPPEGG